MVRITEVVFTRNDVQRTLFSLSFLSFRRYNLPTLGYLLGNGFPYPMLIAALFLSRREAHRKKLIKAMQGA